MKRFVIVMILATGFSLFVAEYVSSSRASHVEVHPPAVRQAVEKSLTLLDRVRLPFIEQTGCVSCHHNSLPAMATTLARERGFAVNEQTARKESEMIFEIWNAGREKILQGDSFPGDHVTASYVMLGLAANNAPANRTTDAVAYYLMGRQSPDGHWASGGNRPPLAGSEISVTAHALRALHLYAPKGLRPEAESRIARARAWLLQAVPKNNEEQTFQLLGLHWANADKPSLRKLAKQLLARQQKDGGWGQETTLNSDAYATGQALVALHQAGGLPVSDPAYQRGVAFLLSTQAADGSWEVRTRSFPFQKYFESGFPYKRNQWISVAATSWATMALTLTVEPTAGMVGKR